MEERIITSKSNPKIKQILGLRNKSRLRKEANDFLIEGIREIDKAISFGVPVKALFVDKESLREDERVWLVAVSEGKDIVYCSSSVMKAISYKEHGDRILAIAERSFLSKEAFLAKRKSKVPFYLLIEGVEKPGNLGAVLRSADAVGVDGVVVCDSPIDIFSPNVVRASLGTCFTVPMWSTTSKEALEVFLAMGCQVIVTTPSASRSYLTYNFTLPTVLVFGSEKDGVTPFWLQSECQKAVIPMQGAADSLNLGMSVTLICYEVFRQRAL